MPLTTLIYSILAVMVVLYLALLALERFTNTPVGKGWLFEWITGSTLKKHLDPKIWTIFKNITLEKDGKTTQIDFVLVSQKGVVVIECKNYSGWIFGSEDERSWTQTFFRKKFYFQNPLRQNRRHIEALAEVLELDPERLTSVVLFSRNSEIKTDLPAQVCQGKDALFAYLEQEHPRFTAVEASGIKTQLSAKRLRPGRKTTARHIENVEAGKTYKPDPEPSAPPCPKCEIPMTKRLGKTGKLAGQEFWGCSTFPKCRQRILMDG